MIVLLVGIIVLIVVLMKYKNSYLQELALKGIPKKDPETFNMNVKFPDSEMEIPKLNWSIQDKLFKLYLKIIW